MHRPLRVPLYLRVGQFLKNLLLLNRNDWNKASDGLSMPTLSRTEREKARPKPEQDIIRPREKPRARLDTFRGATISDPERPPQVSQSADRMSEGDADGVERDAEGNELVRKRRKKRRYRRHSTSRGSQGNGFFRRVFGKPSV